MFARKITEYKQRRAQSAPLPRGISPVISSSNFKSPLQDGKPLAKQHDHHLSTESLSRHPSTLKASVEVSDPSSILSLGIARPHPENFPWNSVCFDSISDIFGISAHHPCGRLPMMVSKRGEEAYDLNVALNYGHAAGSSQILRFMTEHVELVHDPPYRDWEVAMTCGSTSAVDMILRMLCNRGDYVLAESCTYPGFSDAAKSLGLKVLGMPMDADGLMPDALKSLLAEWRVGQYRRPHVLYMVPTGQNPTGITQSAQRRKAIYEIADQYDVLIIEDDPYYFLQLVLDQDALLTKSNEVLQPDEYLSQLKPSYLSLDTSGRVVRLDTASKILAPGLRCGWVTASLELIERFLAHTELSVVSPSGLSQVAMFKLLDENWGHEGFILWLSYLSNNYIKRLQRVISACHHYLPPKDICEYQVPSFGMFLWVEFDVSKHPELRKPCDKIQSQQACAKIEDSIYLASKASGVLISKGSLFSAAPCKQEKVSFRLTFAAAPIDSLERAIEAFAKAIWSEYRKADGRQKTDQLCFDHLDSS